MEPMGRQLRPTRARSLGHSPSSAARNWTRRSPKFGASSVLFDGSGDRNTVPNGAGLQFGSGQFTIEAFVRFAVLDANSRGIMGKVA